jgi:hypothetical protein
MNARRNLYYYYMIFILDFRVLSNIHAITIARYDMYFAFLFLFRIWLLDGSVHLVCRGRVYLLD